MSDTNFDNLFLKVAVNDDEQSFRILFNEFYPALCIFANKIVFDLEASKDIVQNSFYKIWKRRKSISIDTSFRNFLITTVRNDSLDYLRRERLSNKYTETLEYTRSDHDTESPEEIYTLNELEEIINDAISKLPDNVREAFEFSRFKGLTYNQYSVKFLSLVTRQ